MDDTTSAPDDRWAASRARDAQWVLDARAGDQQAFGRLYDAWFDRAYEVANRIVRNPDTAAECAQDTFLAVWRNLDKLENPDAFGGWVLRIARNNAFNRSAKEQRSTAVDDQGLGMIETYGSGAANAPDGFRVEDRLGRAAQPGAALEDAEAVALVWEAAEALGERDLEVLDLSLRHGLTPAEIADIVGLNRNAANQLLHRVRGRLETAVRARVLWRGGEPACDELAGLYRQAGVRSFDAEAVKIADRHTPTCATCNERQAAHLQPSALFASVPIVVAPLFLKQQAAGALEVAGVPMSGSAFSPSGLAGGAGSGGAGSSGAGGGSATTGPGAAAGPGGPLYAVDRGSGTVTFGDGATGAVPPGGAVIASSARQGNGNRGATFAAVAAVVVAALLLGAAVLSRGDGPTEVAATGASTTTVATTALGTTSTTAGTSSTTPTTGDGPTTTTPPTTDTGPTSTPPTTAPTTSTSTSTTTTTVPLRITFAIDPSTQTGGAWPLGPTAGPPLTPTLTWDVTPATGVDVSVTGPEGGKNPGFTVTTLSGTRALCPGTRSTGSAAVTCLTPPGAYTYTLTVTDRRDAANPVVTTRTATLTVLEAPIR